ncbi:MAG TPA: hypothetical protein VFR96_14780 [Povalibacter sp.]|nr:hypothetical protein [Povalibacter sp.]
MSRVMVVSTRTLAAADCMHDRTHSTNASERTPSERPGIQQELSAMLGEAAASSGIVRLCAILQAMQAATSLDDRVDALHDLIVWTRRTRPLPGVPIGNDSPQFYRFTLLIDLCERSPAVRAVLKANIDEILADTSATNLIGTAGLPSGRGFLAEATDRLIARILPRPREDYDLGHICLRLFRHADEARRMAAMPPALFGRLVALVMPEDRPDLVTAVRADFADGLRLLGTRVRAFGLHEKVRERCPPRRVAQSPFFQIAQCIDELAQQWAQSGHDPAVGARCRELVAACREEVGEVLRRIESSGVSVDIVYSIEMIERCLVRMEQMIAIVEARDLQTFALRVHEFLARLIRAAQRDRSVRQLLRDTTGLLGRKVVERTGEGGGHYVARTGAEYRHIWVAAAGGGIVASCIGAMKFPVLEAAFAPFVEGLMLSAVYIGGFLFMQALGLILATKQPAMFGATVADIVRTPDATTSVDETAQLATHILRSQLAATLSNLVLVSLTAFAISSVWSVVHTTPYLDPAQARHTYEDLVPLRSGTIVYASLTGVLLWLASMAGGLLDNWSVYHRIPQGIADHPLGRLIGWQHMARLAGIWSRRIADAGTNIALGLLLGMTPVLGEFFGLPLDVRHVTLSTGKLMLGVASLGDDWYQDGLLWQALAGVAVTFVFNLGVSFLLALYVALRAYGLPRRRMFTILAQFGRRVRHTALIGPPRPTGD